MAGLCSTCIHFEKTTFKSGKTRDHCGWYGISVTSEAVNCRRYSDGRLRDFEKMAWILEKKRKIGFDFPIFEFNRPKEPARDGEAPSELQ